MLQKRTAKFRQVEGESGLRIPLIVGFLRVDKLEYDLRYLYLGGLRRVIHLIFDRMSSGFVSLVFFFFEGDVGFDGFFGEYIAF